MHFAKLARYITEPLFEVLHQHETKSIKQGFTRRVESVTLPECDHVFSP